MIAEVAFNIPIERSFHYLVPSALQAAVRPGVRVAAPFGARERIGFVVRLPERSPVQQLKAIRRVIDPSPVIEDERWDLASWIAAYYGCSLGEALAAMVPSDLRVNAGIVEDSPAAAAPEADGRHVLSPHQRRALDALTAALDRARCETILLHGVTGSGKTELYLRAIEHALGQGRSAIYLVPEIALTPQTIDRVRERFGEQVAVWHSRLSRRARAEHWSLLAAGRRRIVVGARSAIFAPVKRLGS